MINFTRRGTTVVAQVTANVEVEKRVFNFEWQTNDEVYACLLVRNFEVFLRDKIAAARRDAYHAGYKDAKAKSAKETWFSGSL